MPRAEALIVGQGLAGTTLAWSLERAGVPFRVIDPGHAGAASLVAAGLVTPITGRRFVKSWRIDALLPQARAYFQDLETELGIACWRDLTIRRCFADERERRIFTAKHATGELEPFVGVWDDGGFFIEPAAQVDLRRLLAAMRRRLADRGQLTVGALDDLRHASCAIVIDARGRATTDDPAWAWVPWAYSKGEVLEIITEGLERDRVLNAGQWVLPVSGQHAWVGATHEPGRNDTRCTAQARATLESAAQVLLQRPFSVVAQAAGVRVTLPDKRPVVGRHPAYPQLGVVNGLGAKGVMLAPWLAEMWARHLVQGAAFDPEVAVTRFA